MKLPVELSGNHVTVNYRLYRACVGHLHIQ